MRWPIRLLKAAYICLIAALPVAALANYAVTAGSGTNFGSVVIGGVHFASQLICDFTTANQCASVKAASTSAAQTDSAVVVRNPDTGASGAAHQCTPSSSSTSAIACLGQIDDDVKSSIAAGSAVIGKVGIDQTTPGTTNLVALTTTTNAGAATVKGGVAVVNGGSFYEAVAASQTATVLQSSTGAAGDYLSHCVIYPTSTTPGVVTVFDSTNTPANSAILFAGGSSSVSNLAPIPVPVGANSVNGAWKVTTGSNVSVVCYGKFS